MSVTLLSDQSLKVPIRDTASRLMERVLISEVVRPARKDPAEYTLVVAQVEGVFQTYTEKIRLKKNQLLMIVA